MKCNAIIMKYTGYLHVFSLLFAIFGTYKQIEALNENKKNSIWLTLSLTFMLLLRIPNQICLSLIHPHGWYNVVGTFMGAMSFAYLTYLTHEKNINDENKINASA